MVLKSSDDFQIEWQDAADARLTWMWDQMHNPRPMCQVAQDVEAFWSERIFGGRMVTVNGYGFRSFGAPPPPPAGSGAPPAAPAMPPSFAAVANPLKIWEEENLPKIRQICSRIRAPDYEAMSAARLGTRLDELMGDSAEAMSLTFGALMSFGMATNVLVDFCERETGPDGAVRATTMIQGFENESSASGAGLSRLADVAAASPEVEAAIRAGRFDDIAKAAGGEAFLAELGQYLEDYGWRVDSWGQIEIPTWAEAPKTPLSLIRRYLSDPERSPAAGQRRAATQREETIRDTEARLSPDKLPRFRDLLKAAQDHVPVSEGRALWQLITIGVLRIPFLALGRKLVAEGLIDRAEDVFFLHVEELKELASGLPKVAPRPVIAQRRADHERWGKLIPPRYLGTAPAAGGMAGMMRFFGYGIEVSPEATLVNGHAASKGTARGRARVIMDLADADRLEPGDVLVCPSTAPPWTPLFAIAAAVVTDSGGVLSHSAIAAREYAIPAVVGTQVGTQKIPDGAIVTVDGGQGIVRIESDVLGR